MTNPQSNLPPGFRFHPTDEELILHYLRKKLISLPLPVSIIAEVDIYKFDPWDLPARAAFGEKEWYFFSPRDRKYPNGARPNRAAASGYWKATGTDKTIIASSTTSAAAGHQNIGVKKALVFYKGKPPKGIKTNWIMHEYRLAEALNYNYNSNNKSIKLKDSSMRLDDWVLCRIYKKSGGLLPTPSTTTTTTTASDNEQEEQERFIQDIFIPSLKNTSNFNTLNTQKSASFSNLLDAMDYSMLSSFLSESTTGVEPNMMMMNHQENQMKSSNPLMENRLKREHSSINEDIIFNPSKKIISSCSFSNGSSQSDIIIPPNNLPNQYSFFNQQIVLNPHLHI